MKYLYHFSINVQKKKRIMYKIFQFISNIYFVSEIPLTSLSSLNFFLSPLLLLFPRGKSVARMIECVACFSVNNCRRVRLAELHRLHRRGDEQDLDVRAGWRILDFEWVSLQRLQYKQTSLL